MTDDLVSSAWEINGYIEFSAVDIDNGFDTFTTLVTVANAVVFLRLTVESM